MSFRILLISLLAAVSLPAIATATESVIDERLAATAIALRDRALGDSLAYELVASLTTEVGPRLAGSEGDRRAVAWAEAALTRLGFSNVRRMPVTVPHWERGRHSLSIVAPYPQRLVASMLGGSVGTGEAGITAEVVRVASLDALAALPTEAVAGKIVFVDQHMPRRRDGSGYGETVPIRVAGPGISAARGALAHLIRSVGTDNERTGHTGTLRYPEGGRAIPALALSGPDADLLSRQIDLGKPVQVHLQSTARYLADAVSYNVIGEIPGRQSDEIVLLGAHLDSWDEGTGAHDDGAGVAIVTAAAKLIGDLPGKPRRTLRVVLFANEEFGLSGARQYLADYNDSVAQHVIGMEADLGAGAVWQFGSRVADEALPIIADIHALLAPLGIERGDNEAFGGADIGPLRDAGMPVFGIRQDASLYFDYHHTPGDTLDKIVPADIAQNTAVYAIAALIAAEIEQTFGRLATPQ